MNSSVEISKKEFGFPGTNSGGMVLKLLPVLIPKFVEFLTLMGRVRTKEVRRARSQAEGDLDKSFANLVYGLYVGLYGRVDDHSYARVFMFDGAI